MISSLNDFQHPFFIGVAGTGMSALAQYLQGIGKNVSGSDRYFKAGEFNDTKEKLEAEGINCFLQDGSGIRNNTDLIVVSTAIEDTVYEVPPIAIVFLLSEINASNSLRLMIGIFSCFAFCTSYTVSSIAVLTTIRSVLL